MRFRDRLYKQIETHPRYDVIMTSEPMRRLHRVSLSVVPSWLSPTSVCSSKFEHSVGVLHLAEILTQSGIDEAAATNLQLAALLHDVGTPPFSHGSELLLERFTGKDHEAFAENILYASELDSLIVKMGGSTDTVASYIRGEHMPLGALVCGQIDVDNLDNTLRFGTSMGLLFEQLYDPTVLARGLYLDADEVALKLVDMDPLNRWEQCRREVYTYVNSVENLSTAMMLYRAMTLAYEVEEIGSDFFLMLDDQAYDYLINDTNPMTRRVMERLDRWQSYDCVYGYRSEDVGDAFRGHTESERWDVMSDEIATLCKIPREDVSVRIRKDKGAKQLTLPIYDLHGNSLSFESQYPDTWMAQVFVADAGAVAPKTIHDYMHHRLEITDEAI